MTYKISFWPVQISCYIYVPKIISVDKVIAIMKRVPFLVHSVSYWSTHHEGMMPRSVLVSKDAEC